MGKYYYFSADGSFYMLVQEENQLGKVVHHFCSNEYEEEVVETVEDNISKNKTNWDRLKMMSKEILANSDEEAIEKAEAKFNDK